MLQWFWNGSFIFLNFLTEKFLGLGWSIEWQTQVVHQVIHHWNELKWWTHTQAVLVFSSHSHENQCSPTINWCAKCRHINLLASSELSVWKFPLISLEWMEHSKSATYPIASPPHYTSCRPSPWIWVASWICHATYESSCTTTI